MTVAESLVDLVGWRLPIDGVIFWGGPPAFEGDSGFTILFSDAPPGTEITGADDPRWRWYHLECLIEEHPEIGVALDMAKEHGYAELNAATGEWVAGEHGGDCDCTICGR